MNICQHYSGPLCTPGDDIMAPFWVIVSLQVLGSYQCYEHLYVREREVTIQEFHNSSTHLSEYEGEMEHYERLEAEVMELPASQYLNAAIQLSTG